MDDPSGKAYGSNADLDQQGTGVLGKTCCEGRGRGEFAKEGHPDPGISGMLICQNTDNPPRFEKVGGCLHLFFTVEGVDSPAAAVTVHKIIHERTAQSLIDTPRLAWLHEFRDLCVDLPVSEMTEGRHGATRAGFFPHNPVLPVLLLIKIEM